MSTILARLRAFGAFWYDFVVGDDWLVAAGIVVAFVITYVAARHHPGVWWVIPAAVVVLLPVSLWRASRHS
ncbi:MAG: hypothetical protein ACRDPI_07190 [Nocardioidaceae bacterium]